MKATLSALADQAHLALVHLAAAAPTNPNVPQPTVVVPPNTGGVDTALGIMKWGGGPVAVASILYCGYLFLFSSKRHDDGTERLGKIMFGIFLLTGGPAVIAMVLS